MRTTMKRLAICLPLVAVVGFAIPSSARAATYDGTDPNGTGRAGSYANTEYSDPVPGGTLELRFSTRCLTAWARFTCQTSDRCTNYRLSIHRNGDSKEEGASVSWPSSTADGAQLYTLQLDDGAGATTRACITYIALYPPPTDCTSSFLICKSCWRDGLLDAGTSSR